MPYILTIKNGKRSATIACEDERLMREFTAWAESEFGDGMSCESAEISEEAYYLLPKITIDPPLKTQ